MKNHRFAIASVLMAVPCFAGIKDAIQLDTGLVGRVPGRDASITAFKGIPYAKPPVGDLRWTPPSPPLAWKGVRKADQFSAGCAQDFPQADFPKSEDCLYLNLWTPAKSAAAGLPVMVWIHGGGMRVGSAREALYDGEEMSRKGVVVVTLNYRLGVIGFLAHPELSKESPHHASGNYAVLDQLAALQWVQRNITAFGGDPRKVTIFGQSAGAQSVNSQVASPLSKGLFRAAIAESGGIGRNGMASLDEAEKAGVAFAESVGAKSLAELRAMPVEKLLQGSASTRLTVDGWFFPEATASIFKQSKQNQVPMLLGSNSDEAQHMIRSALPANQYMERAHKDYGDRSARFLELYPGNSESAAKTSQQRLLSDQTAVQEMNLAEAVTQGGAKAFLYFFDYLDEGGYNSEPTSLGLRLGADHGAEIPYVLGLLNHWKAPVPANDFKLQNLIMDYWANFAKTLDPNGPSLPVWKAFDGSKNAVMKLDGSANGMQPHPRTAQVEFLRASSAE
jgi:para-nitrobenzyl esterase